MYLASTKKKKINECTFGSVLRTAACPPIIYNEKSRRQSILIYHFEGILVAHLSRSQENFS